MCASKTINFKYNIGDVVYFIDGNNRICKASITKRYSEENSEGVIITYRTHNSGVCSENKLTLSLQEVIQKVPMVDFTK